MRELIIQKLLAVLDGDKDINVINELNDEELLALYDEAFGFAG